MDLSPKFFAFAPHRHFDDMTANNQERRNSQEIPGVRNPLLLDEETLARIMQAAVTTALQASERVRQSEVTTPIAPIAVLEKALQWNDFPKWPGKCDRIDAWFQNLEAKLKAGRIPEDKWAGKLMECPKIGDELKRRLNGLQDHTYEGIRKHCLAIYGPVDPVGYFRSQIYSVKGTNREDVMEKLEDARALHNRAARMETGRAEWDDRDLLYPFINAFPEEVATKLRQELAGAIRNGNPLQELVSRAPSQADFAAEEEKVIPLVGQIEGRSQKRTAEDPLVAEIRELKRAFKSSMAANRQRPSQPPQPPTAGRRQPAAGQRCSKCGGSCAGPADCPAQNRECFKCGKLGHFRSACRDRAPPGRAPYAQGRPKQLGTPPFMNGQDRY